MIMITHVQFVTMSVKHVVEDQVVNVLHVMFHMISIYTDQNVKAHAQMVLMLIAMAHVMFVLQDVPLVMEPMIIIVFLAQVDNTYLTHNVITLVPKDTLLMILPVLAWLVHIHVVLVLQLIHVTLVQMDTTYT